MSDYGGTRDVRHPIGRALPSPVARSASTSGTVTISAPDTATIGNFRYRFVRWSDGGARTHDITVPTAATTLTALYEITGTLLDGTSPGPPVTLRPKT